jgi:GAF domain-containing protein
MHWLSLKELLAWNPLDLKGHNLGFEKIRFDNAFRIWVSTSSLLVMFGLWFGGVISTFKPVSFVFLVYGAVQAIASFMLKRTHKTRMIDFVVCGVDMVALSAAVYWSGGATSPLYFIYFVPLIIQAFHRDWVLILYYGFGGVSLYSVAVLSSLVDWRSSILLDLSARLFFMLMTVSIAALAVNLLRKRDEVERVRFSRMKFLTYVAERLGRVSSMNDLPRAIEEVITGLNVELAPQLSSWSRVFMRESDSHFMKAFVDPSNGRPELARELTTSSCPVMLKNKPFYFGESSQEPCPTETFSFKSHLCLPITGTDGEPYGVLFSGSATPNAFMDDEIRFLEFITASIGLTAQRLARVEDLDLTTEMNSCAMAAFVGSTHGTQKTHEAILDGFSRLVELEDVGLMIWDAQSATLKASMVRGAYAGRESKLVCHVGEGIPGKAFESGELISQNDLTNVAPFPGSGYKYWLSVPIRTMRGGSLGVLNAWSCQPFHLSSRRRDIVLMFAARIAVAVENALEREQMTQRPDGIEKAA